MSDFLFDPKTEEGSTFTPIPPGDYLVEIIDAEIKQPNSGNGLMLALTWRVSTGDYEGRMIWDNLCYMHPSAQAQQIARRRLKDICAALTIDEQISDPSIFKHKPLRVRVGIKTDKTGQYDDANKILRIMAAEAEEPSPAPAKASAPPTKPKAVANGPSGTTPWNRAKV